MTKPRPPLSPAGALGTIASWPSIGWERIAEVVKRTVSAVRNWGDPDTSATVTFIHMLQLDNEFVEAGGGFRPFLAAFIAASDLEDARLTADRVCLAEAAAAACRESGQADAAVMVLGANPSEIDLAAAEKEQTQAYEARGRVVQLLRAMRARVGRKPR